MNVLICDDEPAVASSVSALLQEHCIKSGIPAHFYPFSDPCAIKDLCSYDLAFLDIDMGSSSGIDLAQSLRKGNPGIVIVFLTNFIQYAPESFEVQAFRYLLKSDMPQNLLPYFEDAVREVIRKKRIITISVNSELIDIPVSHILYLETSLRIIILHLIHDERTEYHFYGSLSDLAKKLEGLGFLRVQRSFLVNMEYIVQLQYEKVTLTGGVVLPSSAKSHKELKQHYLLWRGKTDGQFLELSLYRGRRHFSAVLSGCLCRAALARRQIHDRCRLLHCTELLDPEGPTDFL